MTESFSNPQAEILATHTPPLFARAVERTVECLRAGELVVVPTETVYGLAANAWNPEAVRRIFEVKGRPASNPLIVHVASLTLLHQCARSWPESAERLARTFWPGPLTLVVHRTELIPDEVTAGGNTVALRWPEHPFIQAVIRAAGFPLAAPSANPSYATSPTTAEDASRLIGSRIPLIVDGGACQVGIESTVVDVTASPPVILRPGMIDEEQISGALKVVPGRPFPSETLRSPGLLERHYAPRATLLVGSWTDEEELRQKVKSHTPNFGRVHILAHDRLPSGTDWGRVCLIPQDAPAYARAMYAEWHRCDQLGARWIVVEAVPAGSEWLAIADRLRRAGRAL